MGNRVPRIDSDRFVPILLAYTEKPACDLSVRLVPSYLLPSAARASNGASEPVGIFILFLEAVCLRTDIAARKRIVFIAAHTDDRLALDFDSNTTSGFTERTNAIGGTALRHSRYLSAVGPLINTISER